MKMMVLNLWFMVKTLAKREEGGTSMTVKVGSTVKTTYKTKLIHKGEIGTVKEIYDVVNIPKVALVDFKHSVICFFVRDLEGGT